MCLRLATLHPRFATDPPAGRRCLHIPRQPYEARRNGVAGPAGAAFGRRPHAAKARRFVHQLRRFEEAFGLRLAGQLETHYGAKAAHLPPRDGVRRVGRQAGIAHARTARCSARHWAIASALTHIRSSRTSSDARERWASQTSIGPGIDPICVRHVSVFGPLLRFGRRRAQHQVGVARKALVSAASEKSAPSAKGRWPSTVGVVLSTATRTPCSCAARRGAGYRRRPDRDYSVSPRAAAWRGSLSTGNEGGRWHFADLNPGVGEVPLGEETAGVVSVAGITKTSPGPARAEHGGNSRHSRGKGHGGAAFELGECRLVVVHVGLWNRP